MTIVSTQYDPDEEPIDDLIFWWLLISFVLFCIAPPAGAFVFFGAIILHAQGIL